MNRRAHIEVNDAEVFLQISFEERPRPTDAGVQRRSAETTTTLGGNAIEAFDFVRLAQIALDGHYVDTGSGQFVGACVDRVLVRGHDHIVSVVGESPGQLESDPARGAGHHRENLCHGGGLPVKHWPKRPSC